MTDEEKEFIKKVNVDKAIKKTSFALVLIVLSILTYILPLLVGQFDFGLIFEIISLVFIFKARGNMKKYDESQAKKFIIYSMLAIGWILIYDFLIFCSYIKNLLDLALLGFDYYYSELLLIVYISVLSAIKKDLAKAENPIKYKESTDWFYERLEEKGEEKNDG